MADKRGEERGARGRKEGRKNRRRKVAKKSRWRRRRRRRRLSTELCLPASLHPIGDFGVQYKRRRAAGVTHSLTRRILRKKVGNLMNEGDGSDGCIAKDVARAAHMRSEDAFRVASFILLHPKTRMLVKREGSGTTVSSVGWVGGPWELLSTIYIFLVIYVQDQEHVVKFPLSYSLLARAVELGMVSLFLSKNIARKLSAPAERRVECSA